MTLERSWQSVTDALAPAVAAALPIASDAWHVLFSRRPRPLLMPAGGFRLQRKCLSYFVSNGFSRLYAQFLLRANTLLPRGALLPELHWPRERRCAPRQDTPLRGRFNAAIQIGTPGPYQKASILLLSEQGEAVALAKIALVPSADHAVATEVGWLRTLEEFDQLADKVPRLLAEGTAFNGRRYLVTTLAPSPRVTRTFTPAHQRFLAALGRIRLESLRFRASRCFQYLQRTLAQLEPYVERDKAAALRDAVLDCERSLARWTGPCVIAQGDFAPWNIRVHGERIYVFDWEYARLQASPLADVLHYYMIPRALSGRSIGSGFFAAAMRQGWAFARDAYPEWTWTSRIVTGLALVYLLQVLLHYSRANKRLDLSHPVIAKYWRLIDARRTWMVP
jgi:hypothetical protein